MLTIPARSAPLCDADDVCPPCNARPGFEIDKRCVAVNVSHDHDGQTIVHDCPAPVTWVDIEANGETQRIYFFATAPASCPEDVTGDGEINFSDVAALRSWFFKTCGPDHCAGADVDRSGRVNFADLARVARRFFQSC